eukprot:COSAG01_NODE_5050_length_4524_cov_189.554802_5_plen_322_part_00
MAHVTPVKKKVTSCALRQAAEEFMDSLETMQELRESRFDEQYNRCYCGICYPARWPDTIKNDGPTEYVVPRGWFRFGLRLDANVFGTPDRPGNSIPDVDAVFKTWCVSFHGVKSEEILRSITTLGTLLKPGDKLPDGTVLRSTKCAGRQADGFYTSPTIKYAGLKFYAEPQKFGNGMMASIVLQLRQRPGSFITQGETMAFEKTSKSGKGPWPGHLAKHCPHVPLDTLEWKSQDTTGAIPYGILVRPFKVGQDLEMYLSPVDPMRRWGDTEPRAEHALQDKPLLEPEPEPEEQPIVRSPELIAAKGWYHKVRCNLNAADIS